MNDMKIDLNNMNTSKDGDEAFTPFYAVEPILKYLKPNSTIWCPFDKEWSSFVVSLKENGHNVIFTHIDNGEDFFMQSFDFTKDNNIDYIISNPPYSVKDDILDRLYLLGVPFMMLLPVATIQSLRRVRMFKKYGVEIIIFDGRIGYHNENSYELPIEGPMFATGYFCYKVLPEKLIFENIKRFKRPLKKG